MRGIIYVYYFLYYSSVGFLFNNGNGIQCFTICYGNFWVGNYYYRNACYFNFFCNFGRINSRYETLSLLGTLFLSGLISLGGVSLIYDNTVRPYQVEKSDEKNFVLEDPNKEMEGLFNLPEIEWTDSVCAGGNDGTEMGSKYSKVWANYSEGGFVKVYVGKNYKYLAFSSYSSDEDYIIYADDKKINCEKILEDEKTKVYNLNNCETIKIELKDDDTDLEDVYVYKTQYPTIIED